MKRAFVTVLLAFFPLSLYSQSGSINNTLGTSGVFTIKDASNNYLILSQSTGQVNILRSLRLEYTIGSSTIGVIFKGTDRFLHNYGTNNTFLGINSGNFTMSGTSNTAVGYQSLSSNTTGLNNTAVGYQSSYSNTDGYGNTTLGFQSLYTNTTGLNNTAVGVASLFSNSTGSDNTAVGLNSLYTNTTGYSNTAVGKNSLALNTTGRDNTALGYQSLYSNTTGYENTALGLNSLYTNTSGYSNTALGLNSLYTNSTGSENTAVGYQSLTLNTIGQQNSAFGNVSLYSNTEGTHNTAIGRESLYHNTTGIANTALGWGSLGSNTSGADNTAVGYSSGYIITTGSNLTCIGNNAEPTSNIATNQITLGDANVTSLRCNATTITSLSDARDKKNIKDLPLGLDFLMSVKPRQFNWDKREWYENNVFDGSKMKETPTAGFIAQELDEVQTSQNAEWLNLVLKDNPDKFEATPGNLLPIMVKAIQELKVRSDQKDERITNLKSLDSMSKCNTLVKDFAWCSII